MSDYIKVLPTYLVNRYKGWKATSYQENKSWYRKLADVGQSPRSMIISCCDSRIHATSMFGADSGEFFIHRNIANLVPPYNPSGDYHGTSAAVEYAVKTLKISHLIVLGHSNCGGINSGYDLCSGQNIAEESIFVNKWLSILKPAFKKINLNTNNKEENILELEKESIIVSIDNLIKFPFIKKRLDRNEIILHGLWHNIGSGDLQMLDPSSMKFISI
jgi:carbonic anhydrase